MRVTDLIVTQGIHGFQAGKTAYLERPYGGWDAHVSLIRSGFRCPACGQAEVAVYGEREREIAGLSVGRTRLVLHVTVHRVYCPDCGEAHYEQIPFLPSPTARVTRQVERTVLELRREMARLVGYGDFAALSLDAKMAGSADPVYALFDRVGAVAMEKAKAELADLQRFAEARGCSVGTAFVGHGIGRDFHEEPKVSHVGAPGKGLRLRPGMTFTIEPMINLGTGDGKVRDDDLTVGTLDGKISAHSEHTIAVTPQGAEVLTSWSIG